MKERQSKDRYYLNIAKEVAKRGTCLKRNYGAVIVKNDEIISTGYTGSPRKCDNCINTGKCVRIENNIPGKQRYELCKSVHAEMNAIISASRRDMIDSELYLVGLNPDESLHNAIPCDLCKKMIINAGIKKVVCLNEYNKIKRYSVSEYVADINSIGAGEIVSSDSPKLDSDISTLFDPPESDKKFDDEYIKFPIEIPIDLNNSETVMLKAIANITHTNDTNGSYVMKHKKSLKKYDGCKVSIVCKDKTDLVKIIITIILDIYSHLKLINNTTSTWISNILLNTDNIETLLHKYDIYDNPYLGSGLILDSSKEPAIERILDVDMTANGIYIEIRHCKLSDLLLHKAIPYIKDRAKKDSYFKSEFCCVLNMYSKYKKSYKLCDPYLLYSIIFDTITNNSDLFMKLLHNYM